MIMVHIPGVKIGNKDKEIFIFKGGGGEEAACRLAERYPKIIYFFEEIENGRK